MARKSIKWKEYDYEFVSETEKGFVFLDKDSGNKISLPKKFAEVETDEYDLTKGETYKVFVQEWLATKNNLDEGGINDVIKKSVKLKREAESGQAILIISGDFEFWIPVSWVENQEDIPAEGENFNLEISEWKWKLKIKEAMEEEEVTGRRTSSGEKLTTAPDHMAEDGVEDDIPF